MFANVRADKYYPVAKTSDTALSDVDNPLHPLYNGRPKSELHKRSCPTSYGTPTSKALIDKLDTLAVLASVVCLTAAILVIDPARPYAARLQSSGQIVALGFLLGVMNQCLQRVLPYLFILLETRYGTSTLQNYEGLLRWSPFASKLGVSWRSTLFILFALPLVLSVLYKQFTGSEGSLPLQLLEATCAPTGPPGMQGNVGFITLFSNLTAPFLAESRDGIDVPSSRLIGDTHVYGFNTILLSDTSAAVLDAPSPWILAPLQQKLSSTSSMLLNTSVRATIVEFNSTLNQRRADLDYWDYYNYPTGLTTVPVWGLGDGLMLSVLQNSNPSDGSWDGSWIFIATIDPNVNGSFTQAAVRFDASRHVCNASWHLTRNSIQLVSGQCDKELLEAKYQYYTEAQLGISEIFSQVLAENLGSFTRLRKDSPWDLPTHAVVIAQVYQTVFAAHNGTAKVKPGGQLAQIWNITGSDAGGINFYYNETYKAQILVEERVPTLHAASALYIIVALQPALAIVAYCVIFAMYDTPIARTFGLISIMAGVDKDTLGMLRGAGFSGTLREEVGLGIRLTPLSVPGASLSSDYPEQCIDGSTINKVEFRIGNKGVYGTLKRKQKYY